MQKQCFKCLKYKDLSEFYVHPQMADGHLNKCKECNKKDVSENYHKRREQYAKYEKARFQDPARKQKALEYQRTRRAKHPSHAKAYNDTNHAILSKKMSKKPCEVCGSRFTEAHHDDYLKPFDVRWLCRKHHLEVHGKLAYIFDDNRNVEPIRKKPNFYQLSLF